MACWEHEIVKGDWEGRWAGDNLIYSLHTLLRTSAHPFVYHIASTSTVLRISQRIVF